MLFKNCMRLNCASLCSQVLHHIYIVSLYLVHSSLRCAMPIYEEHCSSKAGIRCSCRARCVLDAQTQPLPHRRRGRDSERGGSRPGRAASLDCGRRRWQRLAEN